MLRFIITLVVIYLLAQHAPAWLCLVPLALLLFGGLGVWLVAKPVRNQLPKPTVRSNKYHPTLSCVVCGDRLLTNRPSMLYCCADCANHYGLMD